MIKQRTMSWESGQRTSADAGTHFINCKAKLEARMSKESTVEAKDLIEAMNTRGYLEREPRIAHEVQAIMEGKAVSQPYRLSADIWVIYTL